VSVLPLSIIAFLILISAELFAFASAAPVLNGRAPLAARLPIAEGFAAYDARLLLAATIA
jgi:hypothetical protein